MNLKFKVLSIVASLFVGSFASAYESDLHCVNMIHARASAAAAQELVEVKSNAYNRLEGILTTIKNGLIFAHCNLDNVNNVAGSVTVKVRPKLFKCTPEVVTIAFVDQTIAALNQATVGAFGGYRQGAINRSTELSADLKAGLESDSDCK